MAVELGIIIVNWNGGDYLERCISSVRQYPPSCSYEIIVVDNASSDQSIDWFRSEDKQTAQLTGQITLVENSANLGFSRANNQGLAQTSAPFILLLNNDAEVTAGAIDSLLETLKTDDRNGFCGPKLLNSDGSLQVSAWRNPPTAWETLLSGLRLYKLLPRRFRGELLLGRFWDHSRKREVGMLSGACILMRREVLNQVGGFDERFHMYAEDNELCLRVLRGGWRIVFDPEAVVVHHGARSALTRWSHIQRQARILNEFLRFQRYSLSRRQVITNILANSFVLLLAALWRIVSGSPSNEVRMKLGLCARHLRQALKG